MKQARRAADPLKRDLSPAILDFGPVRFTLARHFGFCFGVENAIEIAYKTLDAHPDRRVFFLSEMIHNPDVNTDLEDRGVRFIFTPDGKQLIPWSDLGPEDIVVVPAFGTTLEIQDALKAIAPRAVPTEAAVEAALEDVRADDECPSDDDSAARFNNRTKLIQNDPEYFGFVG